MGLVAFLVYLATLHPSTPAGDSGEFIAVARRTATGDEVPPGLYFVRFRAGGFDQVTKLIRIH